MPSLPPELTARYELRGILGEGGMGQVLSCWDRELGRAVAIKLMRDGHVGAPEVRRFHREARLLSGLTTPGVVRIFDAGLSGQTPYLVMEQLEGIPLEARLTPGAALESAEVERMLRVLLATLAEVHDAGMLHRDIKPGNIFLRNAKEPVLIDFGIARQLEPTTQLTEAGMVVGTLRFLSPESLASGTFAPRTDLFSLALTSLECLVDVNVFTGGPRAEKVEPVDIISGLTSGTYVVNAQRALSRRSPLTDAILAGLAHRPENRPDSARAMLAMLGSAKPARPEPKEVNPANRNAIALLPAKPASATPRWAALALTVALVTAALAVTWRARHAQVEPLTSASAVATPRAERESGMSRYARWAEAVGLSKRATELARDLLPPRSSKESLGPAIQLVDLGIANFGEAADRQLPTTAELAVAPSYRRLFELAALDAVTQRVNAKNGGALSCFPEHVRPGAPRPVGGRTVEMRGVFKDWITPEAMLDGFRLVTEEEKVRRPIRFDPALPPLSGARSIWLGIEVARVDVGTYVRVRSLRLGWEVSLMPVAKGYPVTMSHRLPADWMKHGSDPLEMSVWSLDGNPLTALLEPGRLILMLEP
jgi:hypothetical protein